MKVELFVIFILHLLTTTEVESQAQKVCKPERTTLITFYKGKIDCNLFRKLTEWTGVQFPAPKSDD